MKDNVEQQAFFEGKPHNQDQERECILCGRCLEVCPLFSATHREELSPRGKSFLICQTLDHGYPGDPEAARRLLGACLGCGQCATVCPQGRDLPGLLRRLKSEHPGWQGWAWRIWISQARRIWPWLIAGERLLPGEPKEGSIRNVLHSLGDRPRPRAMIHRVSEAVRQPGPSVLFPGCMARWAMPGWIRTANTVFGHAGSRFLDYPNWNCCGFTMSQAGFPARRLEWCRMNIDFWRGLGRPLVVTICATCNTALRGYGDESHLFFDEAERLSWVRAVQPLSSFLDHADFVSRVDDCVMYHRPCHAQENDPDAALLRGILGQAFITSSQGACCGLGGVMRLFAPELSELVGEWYWKVSGKEGIRHVATGCSGCFMQLSSTARKDIVVTHWLDLFSETNQAALDNE